MRSCDPENKVNINLFRIILSVVTAAVVIFAPILLGMPLIYEVQNNTSNSLLTLGRGSAPKHNATAARVKEPGDHKRAVASKPRPGEV